MELHYETINLTVAEIFPEINQYTKSSEQKNLFEELGESPYFYFPALWVLLNLTLTEKDFNNKLRDRIFIFMEEMAISEDKRVVELVTVEMLEPIFGLDFETYQEVTKKRLLPTCKKIHQKQKNFFKEPNNIL
ncbi:hypothetical protein AF927_07260 [Listeria monocytogenes]|uniref:DUF7674 family protein n=1 Tax=Listeria monocytogenes TaxID=1639 RepID=UPI00086F5001|nr:hypothetical protein [Listeria monocytogenes]EAC3109519.1 hypothetical protein [Listeria monocytogenes]EAC5532788.1 hypothetical protein [Listeria monocytogenes]EAC9919723.1 hypothetical protein [Listeria monocytogenes]EAD5327530.1 hypothetical protein [Listeria monocytogenes]EAD9019715.1 hypothetical protein [Listeria monocytogenes]